MLWKRCSLDTILEFPGNGSLLSYPTHTPKLPFDVLYEPDVVYDLRLIYDKKKNTGDVCHMLRTILFQRYLLDVRCS